MSTNQHQKKSVDIPVHKESRTFEQHRREMLTGLQHRHKGGKRPKLGISLHHDRWSDVVDNWVDSSWRSWDDEIRRLKCGMFALLPLDTFGLKDAFPDPFDLMNQMELEVEEIRNRIGMNKAPVTGSLTDFLKDAYEVGEDAKLHFKVRFDAKGFEPENIKVNSTENRVTVYAKKVSESGSSKSSREFCRMIELPRTIDPSHMRCRLTDDGVLMLEAPVKSPDYESITFTDNRQLGIHPKSTDQVQSVPSSKTLAVKGVFGPMIWEDEANGKYLHVEVPVDSVYKPEDLCVNVDSNRVVVSGRTYEADDDCSNKKRNRSSHAEFTHSYEIPETIDPLSVSAQLLEQEPTSRFGLDILNDPVGLVSQVGHHIHHIREKVDSRKTSSSSSSPLLGSIADTLKDTCEAGKDGKINYRVDFDVKGFQPEEINVTTFESKLTVCAKKWMTTGSLQNAKEFSRVIELHQSLDYKELESYLSDGGILTLKGPLKTVEDDRITSIKGCQLSDRSRPLNDIKTESTTKLFVVKSANGPIVLVNEDNSKRLHIEMLMDPLFKSQDVNVKYDINCIIVSGRHEDKSSIGDFVQFKNQMQFLSSLIHCISLFK
ncbi:unnamed protein product [Heterobilharzia americana]|nr:unnamed protein product [Heterobilharzia americana]